MYYTWRTSLHILISSLHGFSIHNHLMFSHHCYTWHLYSMFMTHCSMYSLVYMHCLLLYSCHRDHRSYCMYSYCMYLPVFSVHEYFPLLILIFPLLDMRAVDMWYVESHIYCSRFPLYCSMLSTELRSSYQVNCIMYCICACYIKIIKITWVWGRLDGWLDLIGWCTGSILLVPLQGTVVLPTNSSMSSRYLIPAPLLAEGPGLSSQGSV